MANKYLDLTGLGYFWEKVDAAKVDKVSGKGLSTNDYTTDEKNKLSGIASGAEVNQNAFSNVKVGSTTIAADSKTDTLTITAGSNITLTPDASGDGLTIAATDTKYSLVGANGSTGLIKNGSTVTSTSGLTACPIVSGIPYYKDTNTTYSSMSADELNTGTATNGRVISASVLSSYINSKIAAADAMIFKGTIGTGGTVTELPATHTCGWTYKVATAGTYAGVACEVGDMIICLVDGTTAADADWTVVQTNIDGAVTGPASATSGRIAIFDGTTGKVIKDSGYTIATSVPSGAKFTDTTYSAGTGISISSNKITNAGVRSIATGGTNGTISVNTNGTSAEVAVKGLGSAAYTNSSDYATSGHTHNYAGSSSAGGAATSANKVNSALTLKIKSGTTEGTDLYTFDGSAAKALDIVAGSNVTLTAASGKLTIAASDTKYSLVGAKDSTGLIKNGSSVTSTSGYTACPIISGIPYYKDTNTTYTGSNGITLDGTTFKHSNAAITAGTVGTSSASSGKTISVPYVTYDAYGHITATGTHTHTVSGFLTSHQTIKQDGVTGATANRYAACSTAASTAAKTANVTAGTFALEAGARVTVKFTNANTASTPTLNINSTGAKNIFHKGAQITSGSNKSLLAGAVDFVYDGTQWNLVGNYIDSNTTYSNATTSKAGLMSATDKTNLDNCVVVCNSAATTAITNAEIDTIIAGA